MAVISLWSSSQCGFLSSVSTTSSLYLRHPVKFSVLVCEMDLERTCEVNCLTVGRVCRNNSTACFNMSLLERILVSLQSKVIMDRAENVREEIGNNGAAVTADMETIEAVLRLGKLGEQLIPGIPDDITLNIITTKLSWSAFRDLFSVSRSWNAVIGSGLVYEARVREHSTEALAVVFKTVYQSERQFLKHPRNLISLYSTRNKSWNKLPPVPGREGFIYACRCIPLDAKLYVLGGMHFFGSASREVHVWDLARQSKWKQCASMLAPRQDFSFAVRDGKIYVFGGTDYYNSSCSCEVYDPKVDAWSSIKSEKVPLQPGYQVATMGEELLLHGGEVYNPVKGEWRRLPQHCTRKMGEMPKGRVFSARGKFHVIDMNDCCIRVLDTGKRTWKFLQSFSFSDRGLTAIVRCRYNCLAIDDELLVYMYGACRSNMETCLLRSRGFGQENKELVWDKITSDYCEQVFGLNNCSLLCSIQL